MRRRVGLWLGFAVWLHAGSAGALTIGLAPLAPSVEVGESLLVDLFVEGLGDFAPPSLSTFDVDVLFDPGIVSFSGASFGDPVLGDQLDLFGLGALTDAAETAPGVVNLFELSFDLPDDLDALQPGSFVLAQLSFEAVGAGASDLALGLNALGDALGDPLAAQASGARIEVRGPSAAVPEPGAFLAFAIGSLLVGWAGGRCAPR